MRGVFALALGVLAVACGPPPAPPVRVLFIGNSYTFENNLPVVFAELSKAGKHPVTVDMAATGGWTLAQHVRAQATHDKLAAAVWTYVVLQEQSVIPSLAAQRETGMYPAVRAFTTAIRAASSEPVLLLTWAHRDGFRDVGFVDYASMQAQLTAGYQEIADELGVRVAPAGVAWQAALASDSTLDLWKPDGSHPTLAGSYLAACVLYASLYFESPVGLPAPAAIPPAVVRRLQDAASRIVMGAPDRWHIR